MKTSFLRRLVWAMVAVVIAFGAPFNPVTLARVNVVTLPDRDKVQLTIYNSADLTLVKEIRWLTFKKGLNRLEFSWANTLIDPTSVELRPMQHSDAIEILDVRFPPRATQTLEWNIQSEYAGETPVEIRYFTSGIHWKADYVAEANPNEKSMNLSGNVHITNNSGESYEKAQVRLVVGVVRLVEDIVTLAKGTKKVGADKSEMETLSRRVAGRRLNEAVDRLDRKEKAAEIVKEELSEYFLYTIEGTRDLPDKWARKLPSFQANKIPISSVYKYEKERWGNQSVRFYRFKNAKDSQLGNEPLPDGEVRAFRQSPDNSAWSFVGATQIKYVPINESVDMELGPDPEVQIEAKLMNWEKTDFRFDALGNIKGWTVRESWQIEAQNSKEFEILLDIRRNFAGDWSISTQNTFEKIDARKVKFTLPLQPHAKQTLLYELTTRYGSNIEK